MSGQAVNNVRPGKASQLARSSSAPGYVRCGSAVLAAHGGLRPGSPSSSALINAERHAG